jgi:hypothetical protein
MILYMVGRQLVHQFARERKSPAEDSREPSAALPARTQKAPCSASPCSGATAPHTLPPSTKAVVFLPEKIILTKYT